MKNILKEMRKKGKKKEEENKKPRREMNYSMTNYCTAIFGSQKPLRATDWTCKNGMWVTSV